MRNLERQCAGLSAQLDTFRTDSPKEVARILGEMERGILAACDEFERKSKASTDKLLAKWERYQ